MIAIGRKIYFEKQTGNIILDKGEMKGDVVESTIEQDYEFFKVLSDRIPTTVGVIQLEYGQYAEDFARSNGYRVDVETGAILFSYPDPNEPEEPPVYHTPLTEQISELKAEKVALEAQLAQLNGDLSGFIDFYFTNNPEQA